MKLCLFFTSDLMFSSRVKPLAHEKEFEIRFPAATSTEFSDQPELVIFDLEFVPPGNLGAILENLRAAATDIPRTIAYAPHVKEKLLENARGHGVDEVWTRGQFNRNFGSLFD